MLIFSRSSRADTELVKLFEILQKGLLKDDRKFVFFKFGDGQNGTPKDARGIQVDPDHISKSGNYNALKSISEDKQNTAEIRFVKANEAVDANYASVQNGKVILTPVRKNSAWSGKDFYLSKKDFVGWTTYPVENPPSDTSYPIYSSINITRANILMGQTDVEVCVTAYHEIRAHVLLSKIGTVPKNGAHGLPTVEAEVSLAENEARTNFSLK